MYIDTIDSVSIAGLPCESVESAYVPGTKWVCMMDTLQDSHEITFIIYEHVLFAN